MRKALKRQLGIAKQEQHLKETIESGLKAQAIDQTRRERQLQEALIRRDAADKKKVHVQATSKISQEKKDRVNKRLLAKQAETYEFGMKDFDATPEPEFVRDYIVADMVVMETLFSHDDALDLSSVDC
jgi:hypothetical protein